MIRPFPTLLPSSIPRNQAIQNVNANRMQIELSSYNGEEVMESEICAIHDCCAFDNSKMEYV